MDYLAHLTATRDYAPIGLLVKNMNHFFGLSITDYYLRGDYSANIPITVAENC